MANSKNEISLKMIECFVKSETQTRADMSDEVGLTPSNVSRSLGKLEELLGVELYEPDGQKRRLTSMGRKLLPYAKEVLSTLDHLTAAAEPAPTSILRVGIAIPALTRPLMDLILDYVAETDYFPDGAEFLVQPVEYLVKCADLDYIFADRAFGIANDLDRNYGHAIDWGRYRGPEMPTLFWSADKSDVREDNVDLHFMDDMTLLLPAADSALSEKVRIFIKEQGGQARYRYFDDYRDAAYAASRGLGICVLRCDCDLRPEYGLNPIWRENSITSPSSMLFRNIYIPLDVTNDLVKKWGDEILPVGGW